MNIAQLFHDVAVAQPHAVAMRLFDRRASKRYRYHAISFQTLAARSQLFAAHLHRRGVRPGDKVLMFVKPGGDFPAVTFALFWLGAVPVFIDPGMGKAGLLRCAASTGARIMIGTPAACALALFESEHFYSVDMTFSLGRGPAAINLHELPAGIDLQHPPACYQPKAGELAALLFTSGATGPAKGVEYTHEIFIQQTRWLQTLFGLGPGAIDFPGFPLFSLFTLAMGMTSCPPDLNAAAPGSCDPARLVRQILDLAPTFVAGSPAIWRRVATYCLTHKIVLPSVKQLVMFGAPVPSTLHRAFATILPNGNTYTPYGATEALPIACISGREILTADVDNNGQSPADLSAHGHGTCVGRVVDGVDVLIVRPCDRIMHAEDLKALPTGEIGEILVKGDVVTRAYFQRPDATAMAKVYDRDGLLWHRMGDVGHMDRSGRLWFCGRHSHTAFTREQALYSDPIEGIFNTHPMIAHSALVPLLPDRAPALVVMPHQFPRSLRQRKVLAASLSQFARDHSGTSSIHHFYVTKKLPVDNRHNIKIDRLKLAHMIERQELSRISP